jgi:hypothetical protein
MMTLSWLTQRNLGTYAIGQSWKADASTDPSANSPFLISYLAPIGSIISLVAGELPPGLSWTASPNWITITGTISDRAGDLVYSWTFSITAPSGQVLDQTYEMQVSTRPVPIWVTPGDLGTFPETQSFNLSPLALMFSSDTRATVRLLNGSLPPGLNWNRSENMILISGESQNITSQTVFDFTFRLTNPNGKVSDRTFSLMLIPAAEIPDWSEQSRSLGFVSSGQRRQFLVAATASTAVTYSLVDPVLPNMSIDPRSGVITYQAVQVTSDSELEFTIRARTTAAQSDIECIITVLTVPHAPVWITSPDAIRISQKRYLEMRLQALDPLGTPVIFLPVNISPEFPFVLDSDGLLYGLAPSVSANTTYSITIKATTDISLLGPTVSSDQTFVITILRTNADGILTWNHSNTDILGVMDGVMVNFDCGARSDRTVTVIHSVSGGQLPKGLILDAASGALNGFLEYHPVIKDYWFDITATDGVDTLVRTIRFQAVNSTDHASISVSIPLSGDIKQQWQSQVHALVGDGSILVNVGVENSQFNNPSLILIDGLGSVLDDPDSIISAVSPWCQQLELGIGAVSNVMINGDQVIVRNIEDPQYGSNRSVGRGGVIPDPLYPASLHNLRQAFIDRCGFANAGSGTGASALVVVDQEVGSISQVLVTNSGSGYKSEPIAIVIGSGTGAKVQAKMKISEITVIDPGVGWQIGDVIPLDVGSYSKLATAVVADITPSGGLLRALIVESGSYIRVPEIKLFISGPHGAIVSIELSLELDQVEILAIGSGYDTDTAILFGTGGASAEWQPQLPILKIQSDAVELTMRQTDRNPAVTALDGMIWTADTAVMTAQGLFWQGTTRFDGDMTSFDGGTTRFQETVDPRQTLIDRGRTTWDLDSTTLDRVDQAVIDVQESWGRTLIDSGMTAFDFYAVVFDPVLVRASTHSTTRVQRIVHLIQPQHTGYNITNDPP